MEICGSALFDVVCPRRLVQSVTCTGSAVWFPLPCGSHFCHSPSDLVGLQIHQDSISRASLPGAKPPCGPSNPRRTEGRTSNAPPSRVGGAYGAVEGQSTGLRRLSGSTAKDPAAPRGIREAPTVVQPAAWASGPGAASARSSPQLREPSDVMRASSAFACNRQSNATPSPTSGTSSRISRRAKESSRALRFSGWYDRIGGVECRRQIR